MTHIDHSQIRSAQERREALTQALTLLTLGGIAAASLAAAFLIEWDKPPVTRLGVLVDRSITASPATACDSIGRVVADYLADPHAAVEVMLLGSDDGTRLGQPVYVGTFTRERIHIGEGGHGVDTANRAFLAEVVGACAALPATTVSPLKDALIGTISAVTAPDAAGEDCADEHVTCAVVFKSDLIEESDPHLRHALGKSRRAPEGEPGLIATEGLDALVLCGLSDRTVKRGDGLSLSAIDAAWRSHFADPALPSFQAVCAPTVTASN